MSFLKSRSEKDSASTGSVSFSSVEGSEDPPKVILSKGGRRPRPPSLSGAQAKKMAGIALNRSGSDPDMSQIMSELMALNAEGKESNPPAAVSARSGPSPEIPGNPFKPLPPLPVNTSRTRSVTSTSKKHSKDSKDSKDPKEEPTTPKGSKHKSRERSSTSSKRTSRSDKTLPAEFSELHKSVDAPYSPPSPRQSPRSGVELVDMLNRINAAKKNLGPSEDPQQIMKELNNHPDSAISPHLSRSDDGSAAGRIIAKNLKKGKLVGRRLISSLSVANPSALLNKVNHTGSTHLNAVIPFNYNEKYAQESLKKIFEIMGINEIDIEALIETALSKADESALRTDLLTNRQTLLLKSLKKDTTDLINVQKNATRIVKVQAVTRGWLFRKRYPDLYDPVQRTRQLHYNRIVIEILQREKKYISAIKMLVDRFLTPIRVRMASGKEVLRLEEVSFIFCNIETILEEHTRNVRRLESIVDSWPFPSGVGKALLDVAPALKVYGVYVGNYKNAQDTVLRLKTEKGKFSQFLTEVYQRHTDTQDFLSLLSLPINHLGKIEPLLEV